MRSSTVVINLVVSFLLFAGSSGAEQWVSLGPIVDRSVQQVEVGAGGGQELYGLSDAGVLRSQDGGATWELGGEGLSEVTIGDVRVVQLVADPYRANALYATVYGVGVYRSLDGGAHWHPAANRGLPAFPGPSDLEVDPNRPSKLYMATGSDWIFVSEDAGDSWTAPGPAPPMTNSPEDLAIDPANPDTLYVVGFHDAIHGRPSFAYKSQDGGASWQELDIEPALDFDAPPAAVVVTSGGPGTVYVAAATGKIIRSTDGGATWTRADAGLPASNELEAVTLRALVAHPSEPSTLYVSLERSDGPPGVYRTIDGGDHWEPVGEWPADQPAPRDFAFPPEDPSSVLAAPGPFQSPSAPDTAWRPRRPRLPAFSRFITPHPSDPEVLFTDSFPADFRRSTDGGATWQPFARSLPSTFDGYLDLVVDPNTSQTLYALGNGSVYKSTDDGFTWEEKADGLDSFNAPFALEIDPVDSERLYAWNSSELFGTSNGGETWSSLFEGGDDAVASLAVDPTDTDVLYLGTGTLNRPGSAVRVCRSEDAGATWTCVDTGFPDGSIALSVDPDQPEHLYGAWNHGRPRAGDVVRSLDGGASWSVTSGDLPAVPVVDLALRPGAGSTAIWAATDGRGVYRSTDGGDSWVPVRTGLGSLEVNDLSSGPGGLYAATALGAYRLDETPGAGEPLPPDDIPWVEDPAVPGFRIKTRIDRGGGATIPGTREPECIPETVCFSGAVPGRNELFVRIVGPKPNGWLWPTLVKFSTSRIEIWIEQTSTGRLRYYELSGARPGFDELPGLFDRFGFPVVPGAP